MNVANDANHRQQAQIPIHVPELNGLADRVLTRPAFARQRLADQRDVRRIRTVALVKSSTLNKRNPEYLEVFIRCGAEICFPNTLLILKHCIEKAAKRFQAGWSFRNLLLSHQPERAVGKAAIHWKTNGCANLVYTWNLFEAVDEVAKENRLT